MIWPIWDPTPYTKEAFAAHVGALKWTNWHPEGVTLHNTDKPTIAQWIESGIAHDQRLVNLKHLYEDVDHWHAGPQAFISRYFINGFSPLTAPGVHCSCENRTRIGFEMVGNYAVEPFNSGDGALVRDNAVWAIACIYKRLGLDPNNLHFHKECLQDHHDCPGKLVVKSEVIARVIAVMPTVTFPGSIGAVVSPAAIPGAAPAAPGPAVPAPAMPVAPMATSGITNTSGLNMHDKVGMDGHVVEVLAKGVKLGVTGKTQGTTTTWLHVIASSGKTGWVAARFVTLDFGAPTVPDPTLPSRPLIAMQHLATKGLPKFKCAAIVGGFMDEDYADLRINAVGDKNKGAGHEAHGLGQWRDDRWAACVAFAKAQGGDPDDLIVQLDFCLHEMTVTEKIAGEALNGATTLEGAVDAMIGYERPAGWHRTNPRGAPSWGTRLKYAQSLM